MAHLVDQLDPDGRQLRVLVSYTDYAAEKVRTLVPNAPELRKRWADPEQRAEILARLEERGVSFVELAEAAGHPEADPFDLLCHLAFNAPLRTRRERAQRLRNDRKDFFDRFGAEAQRILQELLEKYAEHGAAQFSMPDILKVPPVSEHGTVAEIIDLFWRSGEAPERRNGTPEPPLCRLEPRRASGMRPRGKFWPTVARAGGS